MTSPAEPSRENSGAPAEPAAPAPTARDRRIEASVVVAVFVIALLVVVMLLNILAARFNFTVDVTRTGRYSLSPRTKTILRNIDHDVEIALVIEPGDLTSTQLDDFLNILKAYDRASNRVRVTEISAGSAGDVAEFDRLVDRLKTLYAEPAERMTAAIDEALDAAAEGAQLLEAAWAATATALREVEQASDAAQAITDHRSLLSTGARSLAEAAEQTRRTLDVEHGRLPIPDYDAARAIIGESLQQTAQLSGVFADYCDLLAVDQGVTETGRAQFVVLADRFRDTSEHLAVVRDALLRLPPLELSEIVRNMQSSSYLAIIGAERASVVPLSALFPIDPITGDTRRFAGEEAISVVIASLTVTETPVVVFLHADAQSLFGPGTRLLGAAQRLSGQRIRLAEWSVAQSPDPPLLPFENAPRVYVVLPPSDASQRGLVRAANLISVAGQLIRQGENVLYHVPPSSLPGAGQADINLEPIAPLGITAASGMHLVTRYSTPQGPVNDNTTIVNRMPHDHIISRAITGLPTMFHDAVPLTISPTDDVLAQDVVIDVSDNAGRTWAETDWFAEQWRTAQPDARADDTTGPWPIAVAVERLVGPERKQQRVIVIGARPWWFTDDVTRQTAGNALANPGNAELLDACIYWLAGLDDLVQPGAGSTEVPRVSAGAPTTFVGWFVILIMPTIAITVGLVISRIRRR
ncbi:MAG: hypothetical protein KAS72_00930 [Phycisphaerales bacterium]|nr:hypothetical protein [Phycisphaerales bacterium]